MNNLKPHEWQILADILDLAYEDFAQNGCYDHYIDDSPEARALAKAVSDYWIDDGEESQWEPWFNREGKLGTSDVGLMRHFARYARQRASEPSRERAMLDVVGKIAINITPYVGSDWGDSCFYCLADKGENHADDCVWILANKLMAEGQHGN